MKYIKIFDNLFVKLGKAKTTKYIKRIPKAGGGYKYIYSREDIKKQPREIELSEINKKMKEARNTKMSFGKHKGKTITEVLKDEPRYLLWASQNTDRPEAELGAYIYINSANMNTEMTFGQYKDQKVREIIKKDSNYLDFLSNEGFSENHVAVAIYEKMYEYVKKNYEKITKNSSLYPLAQKIKRQKEYKDPWY